MELELEELLVVDGAAVEAVADMVEGPVVEELEEGDVLDMEVDDVEVDDVAAVDVEEIGAPSR